MLNDRQNILNALREKPLKVYEVMKRANVVNEEDCQSLLLRMRDEGLVKFDITQGAMADRLSLKGASLSVILLQPGPNVSEPM